MDEAAPTISQDEIDALFGGTVSSPRQGAMERILATGAVKSSHLPMLDTVMEHFARSVSAALRSRVGVSFEVSVNEVSDTRVGQFLEGIALPSLIGVFRAREWDGHGAIVFGPALVQFMIDTALGARSPNRQVVDKKAFTTIERNLVEDMLHVLLVELSASFRPLCEVEFGLERLESEAQAVLIASARSTAVSTSLQLSAFGTVHQLDVLLPDATLEPARDLLSQRFMGEKLGRDTAWRRHLRQELLQTEVDLVAVLCERRIALSEFTRLKVGDQLDLRIVSDDPVVTLRCDGRPIVTGRMGHRGNLVAVRIEDAVSQHEGLT